MRRWLVPLIAIVLIAQGGRVHAQSSAPFHSLPFADHREYALRCAAGFECDVQLESGERVNDGFNAHIEDWDPHIGYSGVDKVTPHLILRPTVANLRTNIILTTTKRTYYLLAVSTDTHMPSYYTFSYPDETYHQLNRMSLATQAALAAVRNRPQAAPSSTPADVSNLGTTCIDYDYSYAVDRSVQTDHSHAARPSTEQLPVDLIPRIVCTDGQHTFIEFPRQQEVPSDLPISLAVTAEGDTLINYTYVALLNRFTIDGVYDTFVLEIGSQNRPLRLRIYHGSHGNPPRKPKPTRIDPPADLQLINRPYIPMQRPLLPVVPTPQPAVQASPSGVKS